jgi:hypothetical protein
MAASESPALKVTPLPAKVDGVDLAFNISMGLRHREKGWKHQLNGLIGQLTPEIHKILLSYQVPLLDANDQPIPIPAGNHLTATDP